MLPGIVLAGIVPASVVAVERFTDEPGVELFAAEQAVITRSVLKRRNEFATVRHCARLALATLGIEPVALVPGRRGAPGWPSGVVGSMTHCAGYRAAAVAHSCDFSALGLDAEPHHPLPAGVLKIIALKQEQDNLAALAAADSATCWDRVLFCAKETLYKAWFPLTGRWLGFEDNRLSC